MRYVIEKLGWHPWAGDEEHPGQVELLQAYDLALRQQHERLAYEYGELSAEQLRYWQPGKVIQNRLRVESGHGIGKTKIASGMVSHFFDTCAPSIVYTFAPSYPQINDLLWKEIRTDRRRNRLPGRVLESPEIKYKEDHFAKGRATDNAHGRGTEKVQGQHGKYLMFVLDEAEGIADYVFNAVEAMTTGGIAIVLMLANPRTRTSKFYKQRTRSDTRSFRISCVWHPNVLANREIVPGAVRRDYVTKMMEDHCEITAQHEEDNHTFEVPWEPEIIYRPDTEFLFRVLGIPPANSAIDTFVPVGRYEAACKREPTPLAGEQTWARMGADVARYGNDMGTLYVRHNGRVWRAKQFAQEDSDAYVQAIRAEAKRLRAMGVANLHVRVDAGGGFSSGVVDPLKRDMELHGLFHDFQLIEVHFNGTPHDDKAYADLATEMYGEAAETLKGITLVKPPEALAVDLTERRFGWVNVKGVSVKRLESKEIFRKPDRAGRSPDDGDGFVLAVAPDHLFKAKATAGTWGKRRQ
ncbi:MAG: hypothetical protein F9K46_03765 [Anaerolineae bacterium]|nr:MAG: hypothetical protein F9K46_03765 [Anaerolineae bacterium]